MKTKQLWEHYAEGLIRIKVDGGYLYKSSTYDSNDNESNTVMCFAPTPLDKIERIEAHKIDIRRSINDLDLTGRAFNCLRAENILYVDELIQKTRQELIRIPNFGHRSIINIIDALKKDGLHLKK